MKTLILLLTLLCSCYTANATNKPALFNTDSYSQLIEEKKHAFLMVMWSLDCPPCIKELSSLGLLYKQNPDLNMVLVSTDSPARIDEINKLLSKFDLLKIDNRVFSTEPVQRLRYSIDPRWYGELPRSYFHDNHRAGRSAVTGILNTDHVLSWLKTNTEVTP
ncbi:MAG: TlpA family protein disulfide reductase [Gammaproteobacteria bacterium]|nr:TlpA family protein disulfide reductase [Gammaproteobacteria bacterium]